MTAAPTPAVPSEPPLTDEAALSDAELASLVELEAAATPAPWGFANGMIARGLEATGPGSYTCIQSVAEMTDVEDRMDWDAGPAYADVDPEDDAEFIVALRNAWPRLVASLRSAREELMSARAERVELIAERDQARAELKRVRHALTVIQAARPPLAHSAAIVEQLALAVRAREMKPEQISADEAERGYHNAIGGYREVARAILRDIDKALTVEEGTSRG